MRRGGGRGGGEGEGGDEQSVRRRLTCQAITRLPYQNIVIRRIETPVYNIDFVDFHYYLDKFWKLDKPILPRDKGE